jgi:signal transduction histidine kinase/ActR/RegA family two-component response regulator
VTPRAQGPAEDSRRADVRPGGSEERRIRWYRLYYVLATLDFVTVAASLTLLHLIMQIYVGSVAMSQQWAEREQKYARLSQLARAVNSPGNDVFDSHDVPAESARMRTALGAFKARMQASRDEVARNVSVDEAEPLLEAFDAIEHTMREMVAEAELIFEYFAAGEAGRAGGRMATMDRKYGNLNEAFAGLFGSVRNIRQTHFNEQVRAAGFIHTLEYLVMGMAVLMIGGALCYGSRIIRAARAAEADRSQRIEALERARAEAHAANHAKSRFLAIMSHEIRTPLNAMFLSLDMLNEASAADETRSYVAAARSSGHALKRLIDDLLDLSKIEAGRVELEAVGFDLGRVLREVLAPHVHRAQAKGVSLAIRISPEVPQVVKGDPMRFSQIVANLVDNAVKFTDSGMVDVSVSLLAQEPGEYVEKREGIVPLRVAVRDTGIGVGADQQARIFEDFVQANESMAKKHQGAGLGLGIARRLVRLMQGELSVCGTPGGGATFWFDVELGASRRDLLDSAPRSASPEGQEILAGRRVLLVEDAPDSRRLAAAMLGQVGMKVDLAADGSEAVAAAAATRYDAILMDIALPGMDGFEATRRIREREGGGDEVPIIALTAHVINVTIEQCLDVGMDDCLPKPVTRDALLGALLRWIEPPGVAVGTPVQRPSV